MANIIVTSTTNTIQVTFGVYESSVIPKKGTWHKEYIQSFSLMPSDSFVKGRTVGEPEWQLSFNGTNSMQVDSVNGVAPTSNSDLYDKLVALLG